MIEPKIKPLVEAINSIPFLKTFSSCEGHFEEEDQTIDDRTKADVRFELTNPSYLANAEDFIHFIANEFGNGVLPCSFKAYKLYIPKVIEQNNFVFVIEIQPINRFETPGKKRQITDQGIQRITKIVKRYLLKYSPPPHVSDLSCH